MTGQENLLCEPMNTGGTTATMQKRPAASVPATKTGRPDRTKAAVRATPAAAAAMPAANSPAGYPPARPASAARRRGQAARGCAAPAPSAAQGSSCAR